MRLKLNLTSENFFLCVHNGSPSFKDGYVVRFPVFCLVWYEIFNTGLLISDIFTLASRLDFSARHLKQEAEFDYGNVCSFSNIRQSSFNDTGQLFTQGSEDQQEPVGTISASAANDDCDCNSHTAKRRLTNHEPN
jgi:hypothetical protein